MYKEQMAMMQAQAHAFAYQMFHYFEQMAKAAAAPEEKAYYKQYQGVAGCMVHGPHGIQPVPMPHFLNFPHPPQFFGGQMGQMQYPSYLMHHPMYSHGMGN